MREMVNVFGKRAGKKERTMTAVVLIVVNKDTKQLSVEMHPISNKEMKRNQKMTQFVSDVDRKVIVNRNVRTLVNQIIWC